MQKISSFTDTADSNGEFSNGSVANGITPTLLEAGWFNAVQRELVNAIEGAEIPLSSSDDSQLLKAINKLIYTAVTNNVYPVGSVKFFASNINPNTLFPGTTWSYIGEDKVIRLAKQDGSDVLKTGGSDSVTISKSNLPNVQLDVTGTAAGVNLGTLSTTEAGGHTPKGKYAESNTSIDGGSSNRRSWATDYGYSDEGLIEPVPNHSHQVTIPDHGHQVSGKTASLGNGESISVINTHIKLMGWFRSA